MSFKLPSRSLVSQSDSAMIQRPDVPRSKFSGSWSTKFTFDAGLLIPFHVEECYPGDHFSYEITPFIRTSTPLFPVLDSQRFDVHVWFVPNRLLDPNWVKLMGQQDAPGDAINYSVPQLTSTGNGFAVCGVGDYMGLPTVGQALAPLSVSAFPFRAYNLIYNQFYRDQNLITSRAVLNLTAEANVPLWRRAKSHDRFTSCLPWPQKFQSPQIASPVVGIGIAAADAAMGAPANIHETPSPTNSMSGFTLYPNHYAAPPSSVLFAANAGGTQPQVFAQTDVNLFRQAMQVQVFMERLARGGTRYTEMIENIFGVKNNDGRMQRPEFVGGGSTAVQFTPIAQTAPTAGVPLGALGAAGTAVGNNRASYAATEHGWLIVIGSIKSELSYSQGVHPMWDRKVLLDYYNPAFAGLGEAAVLRRQIYATGQAANDDVVFGYQERWQELRTHESSVRGLFRPTATGNIDEWHFSQHFTAAPTLGQTFIEDSPPMTRVLAAGALDVNKQYLADVHFRCEMVRPLPTFGTPVGLGRY